MVAGKDPPRCECSPRAYLPVALSHDYANTVIHSVTCGRNYHGSAAWSRLAVDSVRLFWRRCMETCPSPRHLRRKSVARTSVAATIVVGKEIAEKFPWATSEQIERQKTQKTESGSTQNTTSKRIELIQQIAT